MPILYHSATMVPREFGCSTWDQIQGSAFLGINFPWDQKFGSTFLWINHPGINHPGINYPGINYPRTVKANTKRFAMAFCLLRSMDFFLLGQVRNKKYITSPSYTHTGVGEIAIKSRRNAHIFFCRLISDAARHALNPSKRQFPICPPTHSNSIEYRVREVDQL